MENQSENLNKAGIYKLTCVVNGKVYIGKAFNIRKRLNQHKAAKVGHYLKNAILKHGWESFQVDILESFEIFNKSSDNDYLLKKESQYIELFDSTNVDKGYNLCKYSNDGTGKKHSEESKEKMRKAKLGKPLTDATKEKMSQSKLGIKFSEQHKEKLRKPKSEETKRKMSKSRLGFRNNLGNPHSEESKEKMRQARIIFWKNKKQEQEKQKEYAI